jgi:hypothetical protein
MNANNGIVIAYDVSVKALHEITVVEYHLLMRYAV